MHPASMSVTAPLTINPRRIPVLTPDHAAQHLGEYWLPFLLFTDLASGRGNLIYRRYDGNLALIRPAESSSDA